MTARRSMLISPEKMTPEERLQAVAELFSAAVLRLRKRPKVRPESTSVPTAESAASSLDVRPEMSLTVPTG